MLLEQAKNITELIEQLQQKNNALMASLPFSVSEKADQVIGVSVIEKITEPAIRELMAIHDICLISKALLNHPSQKRNWAELERYKPLFLDTHGNFLVLQGRTTVEIAEMLRDFLVKLEELNKQEQRYAKT